MIVTNMVLYINWIKTLKMVETRSLEIYNSTNLYYSINLEEFLFEPYKYYNLIFLLNIYLLVVSLFTVS